MHNIFYVSLLKQKKTKKKRVKKVLKLDVGNKVSKEYKMEIIWDSAVYANKLKSGHQPSLYYLVAWKGYPKEENTWDLLSAVQHLKKLICFFCKNQSMKPNATFLLIDSALPMARPIFKAIVH